jgi:2-polyprenyl-3-methyl-5-hydroxy-6-metoxy-1,4-benzoquinol methylase
MNKEKINQKVQSQYNILWKNEWQNLHKIGPSVRTRNRLLVNYFKKYVPAGIVIDVGCGDGQFLLKLFHSFGDRYEYAAGDISDQALQMVQQHDFIKDACVMDVTRKDTMPDKTYTAVVSSEVLEHIEDWQNALENLAGLVSPDGYMFITVPALMKHWGSHDVFAHHIRRFEIGQIEGSLQSLNFQVLETYCWGWPIYDLYYRFVLNKSAPESVMKTVTSPFKVFAATCMYYLFFLDDLFHTSKGRRLFIVAQKRTG